MKNVMPYQIACMHFEKGMSQNEIADRLNLSKMTVSRNIQKSKDLKIIKITVDRPFDLNKKLSDKIIASYNIQEAIIIKHGYKEIKDIQDYIGQVYSLHLGLSMLDNCVLGIGGGYTVGNIVRYMKPMRTKNLHVVQLMGGLTNVDFYNPTSIIQEVCRKLKAKGTYITSFATVENSKIRDSLMNNTNMGKQVTELWKRCDYALFGLGVINRGTLLTPELVDQDEIDRLQDLGAIGDILGHCFNHNGNFLTSELEDRLISIPISLLTKIEKRVLVAAGEEKADALKGALLSGVVTDLVTDELTASMILKGG